MALVVTTAVGCGSSKKSSEATSETSSVPVSFPAVSASSSYDSLAGGMPDGLVLAPSVSVLGKGINRYGFAIFTEQRKQISDASVALYTSDGEGRRVAGPFTARAESLDVEPKFRSRTTASDPDGAATIYVRDLNLSSKTQAVFAVVSVKGRQMITAPVEIKLSKVGKKSPPSVGDKAIKIDTPTLADVAGNAEKIDTRLPPSTMHEVNFADALGKRPVVLLFATPALCQSRVCGPVADIAEQLKAKYGEQVDFIQMEIYKDNDLNKGFRPQVEAWRLPTEPWLFVIDKTGRISTRIEGAFSAKELEAAVTKVIQ